MALISTQAWGSSKLTEPLDHPDYGVLDPDVSCDADAALTVSVVLCTYTTSRWAQLGAAVASLREQTHAADEIIVVVDHNDELFAAAQDGLRGVTVIANIYTQGLSGARNSGVAAASGSVVAFLDDDAVAEQGWLEQLLKNYRDPRVLGVGGAIEPLRQAQASWFPEEFGWVLGCSYRGLPTAPEAVRNLIGCNMSFRRPVFGRIGGFSTDLGRVGSYPAGCEETEFCIRLQQQLEGQVLYDPGARVKHEVPAKRSTLRYFVSRCYAEGVSKARVSQAVGTRDGLAAERSYTLQTLPQGLLREGSRAVYKGDPAALMRAGSIVIGFCATAAGYLRGSLSTWLSRERLPRERQVEEHKPSFTPTRIVELELGEPLGDLAGTDAATGVRYTRALALVRLDGQPLGLLEIELGEQGVNAAELASLLDARFGSVRTMGNPARSVKSPGEPKPRELSARHQPFVSVIVATHNRTQSLATCLESLAQLDYPNYEIIVVDNAPSSDATRELIQQTYPAVRYVREATPGLAVAHNRGLLEATGSVVAFTDDDVRADRLWLAKLVEGFELGENVGCVTGMIVAAELETPAQAWFEQHGGFNKGFEVKLFNLSDHKPDQLLYPYTAGVFGTGASMAFTRAALAEIGGFDPALGAGSKGVGGDDLAAFFDVVAHGYTLVYQPAAIVHHWHRRDYEGLQKQVYGYGVGLTAFLTKVIVEKPQRLLEIVPLIPRAVSYVLSPKSPKNAKKRADYPGELSRLERRGMIYGPLAYVKSLWSVRHTAR